MRLSSVLRVAMMLALVLGPRVAAAQKALVYCPTAVDASGCTAIKSALTADFPDGVDVGYDGTQGTVDLNTADLFRYRVFFVPSLAETDSVAPYTLLRDPAVAARLKMALLGRRAFWSGTPDQGVVATTRPQKDALIRNLAAWASGNFATVNAPGLVVLQDNSDVVSLRYSWVQAITGFNIIADPRLATYNAVSSLTAAGNAVLLSNGSTLAYANMASLGFQAPSGAPGLSMDAVGKTGTGVGGQVVLITQSGVNTGGAVVSTDKDDYAPGETVVMTGTGFGASETVTILLHEDPTIEPDFTFTTTTDASGGFVFSGFSPDSLDVDVRFILKATGQTSGRVAQTTFTDGNVTAVSNSAVKNATGLTNSTTACAATTPSPFVLNSVYCGETRVTAITGGGTTNLFLRWLSPSNSTPCTATISATTNTTYSLNCALTQAGTWRFQACTSSSCTGGNELAFQNVIISATQNQTLSFTSAIPATPTYGGTYTPTATATSNLPVTVGVIGGCSIASGVVTFTSVGTCTINANQAGNGSFNPAPQVTQVITIAARAITVTADAKTKVYGDVDPALTYSLTTGTLVGTDAATGTLARAAGTAVGTYAITLGTLSYGNNYVVTCVSANLSITARAITVTADAKTKGYGDIDPTLTYQLTVGTLVGTDAFTGSLTRVAGEAVGTYAINQGTLAIGTNYTLTYAGANLTITARAVTVTADAKTKTYGDADPAPTYTLTTGTLVAGDAFTGALARAAGENAGTYAITQGALALSTNYVITYAGANLTIGAKAITVTADAKTKIYGDVDPALAYTLAPGSLVGTDALTGSLSRVVGENVGDYAIQQGGVTGGGNYLITFVGANLSITPRALTVAADPQTKVYGNADPTLTYQLTAGSLVNTDAFSGALARAPGENVGTYAILKGGLTAGGNYLITFAGANLTITTRAISVKADARTKIYGDDDPTLTYQITSGSLAFTDAFSGVLARDPGNGVATYAITQGTLSAGMNYVLSFTGANLTVTPRAITVTADAKTKIYGDTDPALTYSVTTGALYYGDLLAGALARAPGENVASYAIQQGSLTGGTNYTLTYIGASLSITVRAVTATANAQTKTYGDADPALTYSLITGSLAFSDAFAGSLTRAPGENVSTYAISQGTLALSSNYVLTFVGASLTITTRAVTITADAKTRVYGDADPALTYAITSGSLAFTDAFAGSLSRASGENVGSYAIGQGTVALNANYVLSFVGANLVITPRAITATADAKSKVYGDADPALTYQLSSGTLVTGDAFTGSLTRAPGENVAGYAILQGTVTAGANYALTYVGASLSITPRPIGITADPKTKVYGDADPAFTYQISSGSLVAGDAFGGSLARAAGEDVGTHPITVGTLSPGTNYTLSFTGANLTITQRPVTVTADAKTRVYGDADPALTYQITSGSLAFSDAFAGALARGGTENVGSHPINQGSLVLGANYVLTFVGANLGITPRPITVTADDKTKVYGNPDPTLTAQVTTGNLAFSDVLTGSLTRASGEDVGNYAISQGTLTAGTNYTLSFVSGSLSIRPRSITATADAKTKVYGNADPALTYQLTGTLAFTDAFTGSLSRAGGENVGTYAIGQGTLALTANYTLTYVAADLTITVRPVTATADPLTKVYGDADPSLTYQITSGNLVSGDAFSGALTRVAGENVGPYAIQQGTLALSANYALTYAGANLTITARPVTVTADAKTKVYGNADPSLTYQITSGNLVNGDVFAGGLTRVAGENVGSYAIQQGSLALSTNYALGFVSANLSITVRPIAVTADQQTKVYGNADPAFTYQLTSGTLVSGDAFTGALDRAPGQNVGNHAILVGTLTAGTNYALTYNGANLAITPRPITVTADAKTKVYGYTDPALTVQVTVGSLAYTDGLTGALTRVAGENVSSYAIQQGTLAAGTNYTLTYVGASLSITPRPITLQPQAQPLIWTGSPQSPVYSLVVTVGPLAFTETTTQFAGGTYSPTSVTNVGTYTATVSGLTSANYTIGYVSGTVTVLDQTKPTGNVTELLPIPLNGTPILKVNFTDVTTGNSNITEWRYRLDNAPYSAATIAVGSPSPNVNVQTSVVATTNTTDVIQVCTQGKDAGGNWSLETCALLAVYDPTAGFVTGGGWIDSPAGAYTPDPTLVGKANFGFVSKYQKGANVPTGNTEFQFKEGNLNFKSTNFQWLVIQGTSMAQFKGTGTINGAGNYNFLVTANDGDATAGTKKPDSFRIKIANGSTVVYDNKMLSPETAADATILAGGSIQIQSK